MAVHKICEWCGGKFSVTPNLTHQRFCSNKCRGQSIKQRRPAPTFTCAKCGKVTARRRFRMANGRELGFDFSAKYCSQACGHQGRTWRPINPNGHLHSTGYIRVNLPGGKKEFKHRIVMAEILGRPMRKGENVHHKDGVRTNNAPSNLELWTTLQPPGQRVTDKIAFAIEMLRLYPEFARAAGAQLVDVPADAHVQVSAPGPN